MMKAFMCMLFLALPAFVSAQVVISEIMYDAPGSDDREEWVEVYNSGTGAVDTAGWKFNDGANHIIFPSPQKGGQGTTTLDAGGYAILAQDAVTFLKQHPGFSGTVMHTAINLKNTGGTISLLPASGVVMDTVSYNASSGANGNGNSLQKVLTAWISAPATPGGAYVPKPVAPKQNVSAPPQNVPDTITPTVPADTHREQELVVPESLKPISI